MSPYGAESSRFIHFVGGTSLLSEFIIFTLICYKVINN